MTAETVNAQVHEGPAVTFQYDFGDTSEETNARFGDEIVYALAKRALVIAVQGHARGLLRSGKSVEEIQEALNEWKPGAPRAKMSTEDKLRAEWLKMSPEDRANLLREFQGEAAPAPAARAVKRTAA
jgi:hypothetical protein